MLTRHTNLLFLVCLPLFGVTDACSPSDRGCDSFAARLAQTRRDAAVAAAIVIAPQLAIYYQATGHAIVSSYGVARIRFREPEDLSACCSACRKDCSSGRRCCCSRRRPRVAVAVRTLGARLRRRRSLFLVLNTYLIASWWDWQFGGSFGHRGFTDSLPIFAIGLAGLYTWSARRTTTAAIVACVASVAVALSVFQMLQYLGRRAALQRYDMGSVPRGVPEDEVRRFALAILACLAVAAVLTYLRDPPWLATLSSGFRNWETTADGTAFRWAGAHASLFVPSNARSLRIPLRTTFDRPGDWPITVSITIDDEPVDRLVLTDPGWRESGSVSRHRAAGACAGWISAPIVPGTITGRCRWDGSRSARC